MTTTTTTSFDVYLFQSFKEKYKTSQNYTKKPLTTIHLVSFIQSAITNNLGSPPNYIDLFVRSGVKNLGSIWSYFQLLTTIQQFSDLSILVAYVVKIFDEVFSNESGFPNTVLHNVSNVYDMYDLPIVSNLSIGEVKKLVVEM